MHIIVNDGVKSERKTISPGSDITDITDDITNVAFN